MAIGTGAYGALATSPEAGKMYFGGADYSAALSAGRTNTEIFDWINSNMSKLSPGARNQPGGGDLYDQIQASALREKEVARQEEIQRQAAAAQAERLRQMEISARTQAANTARAGLQSNLQIKSQSKSPQTSGTQGFKRRSLQVNPTAYSAIAATPSTSPGVINV